MITRKTKSKQERIGNALGCWVLVGPANVKNGSLAGANKKIEQGIKLSTLYRKRALMRFQGQTKSVSFVVAVVHISTSLSSRL